MTQCDHQCLQEYLASYGWRFHVDEKNVIHSGWSVESRAFKIKIERQGLLISFEVDLFSFSKLSKFCKKHIWEALLKINRCISLVKLGIDTPGHKVVLLAEVFSDDFSYEALCRVLGLLGYYGERVPDELMEALQQMEDNTLFH